MSKPLSILFVGSVLALLPSVANSGVLPMTTVSVTLKPGDACNSPNSVRAVLKNVSSTLNEVNAWICLNDSNRGWQSWYMTRLRTGEENSGAYVCSGSGNDVRLQVCTVDEPNCPKPC